MKPRPLCERLNDFLIDGLAVEAFMAVENHVLSGPPDRQILGPVNKLGMLSPGGISFEEFVDVLESNSYSCVFFDGAIAIVQCIFSGDKLYSHRYTYIPCPIDQGLFASKPEEISYADWMVDVFSASGGEAFRSRGTYRFDCVPLAGTPADPHPVSHLTFASPDCRVPVRSPLSPSDFFSFLIDNFYRPIKPVWLKYMPHLRCEGTDATLTAAESQLHHINWV